MSGLPDEAVRFAYQLQYVVVIDDAVIAAFNVQILGPPEYLAGSSVYPLVRDNRRKLLEMWVVVAVSLLWASTAASAAARVAFHALPQASRTSPASSRSRAERYCSHASSNRAWELTVALSLVDISLPAWFNTIVISVFRSGLTQLEARIYGIASYESAMRNTSRESGLAIYCLRKLQPFAPSLAQTLSTLKGEAHG